MPELLPLDRLQPALLDRLSDDDPALQQEPREARVITRQRLRVAVVRDLAWLFNATRPGARIDWSDAPCAEHSVLNYGLPSLTGETASALDLGRLEQGIRRAITDFEPRIDPATLSVQALVSEMALDQHNQVRLRIRAHLWAQPVPIEMLLQTAVDLETGHVEVHDAG